MIASSAMGLTLLFCVAAPVTEDTVRFTNGAVALTGTRVVPETGSPVPGIVFLHGSGPMSRDGALSYARRFAELGIGSLAYDKRGVGESGGSWIQASLTDLAEDGLAAIRHLQQDPRFDPERIGFWGVSQAGWVASKAAGIAPDAVAFLVIISGGGVTPLESEIFSYQQAFERAGLSRAMQDEAFAVIGDYFWYLATGQGRPALVERLQSAETRPWYPHASLARILPAESNRQNWAWVARWDPVPSISRIRGPVLLMFGDADRQNPTAVSVRKWQQGLRLAGNNEVQIQIFEGAGHGIRLPVEGHGHQRGAFAEGYHTIMERWLLDQVVTAPATTAASRR